MASMMVSPLRWTLLVALTLTLTLVGTGRAANECSFVRSYQNEQCVYNIHLNQDSGPCPADVPRGRRHFRRHLPPPQNDRDYTEKINSMEKDFSFMKDAHEKRLQELEGTVRGLLGSDRSFASLVETSVDHSSPSGSGGPRAGAAKPSGRSLDDNLLNTLNEEFAKLRNALKEKTEQLFDLQLKFNDSKKTYEKAQVDLFGVNQDLLYAENKIALLERERAVLKNQIKDRSYKLDVCSERLTGCEGKLGGQEEQLLGLIRSENTLSEGLMTCELTLNITKTEMKKMERRHRHMKTRHARVKEVLAIREKELIDCYAAKTQTFCGFEDPDLCGFTQPNNTNDFFDWEWGEGTTPSRHTGPSADHTCRSQKGHFMFVEASAKGRGKNAVIFSPLYRGLNAQCLQFYYHMHGRHVGTLNVYAKAQGGEELSSVWRAWGKPGRSVVRGQARHPQRTGQGRLSDRLRRDHGKWLPGRHGHR
ncbi:uncharacterized protein LOC143301589 [Babylonia areolata]|uniref:uncharacterized protein LOC143301589 n=1 Tax=Babylonia areolata TaxID=304850 RepID=UPI003FD12F8E